MYTCYKGYINVVALPLTQIVKVDAVIAKQPTETPKAFIQRLGIKNAIVSNGTMFENKTGNTIGNFIDEGKRVSYGFSPFGMARMSNGALAFVEQGTPGIVDFVAGQPSLIRNSAIKMDCGNLGADLLTKRHPRKAFGKNATTFFVVDVDGRLKDKPGMTIAELAQFMLSELKCTDAIAVDGGGSCYTADVNGAGVIKVLNTPTENRPVDNYLVITYKEVKPMINIINETYAWRASVPFTKRVKTDTIILHHADASNCTVQDIHKWHLERDNGTWAGIGYHFVVYKDGTIHTGRPIDVKGAHAGTANATSIGICAVGAYNKETMPDVQKQAILDLLKYLDTLYPNCTIIGHKEAPGASTDCPGTNYPLADIKAKAKEPVVVPHWAQKHYDELKAFGVHITDTRFDDKITRGEVFALLNEFRKAIGQ